MSDFTNYTYDENTIIFLKDTNIVDNIYDVSVQNAVPSLCIVQALSTETNDLSTQVLNGDPTVNGQWTYTNSISAANLSVLDEVVGSSKINKADISSVSITSSEIDNLSNLNGYVQNLKSDKISAVDIQGDKAEYKSLSVESAQNENLSVSNLSVSVFTGNTVNISTETVNTEFVNDISAESLSAKQLSAVESTIETLSVTAEAVLSNITVDGNIDTTGRIDIKSWIDTPTSEDRVIIPVAALTGKSVDIKVPTKLENTLSVANDVSVDTKLSVPKIESSTITNSGQISTDTLIVSNSLQSGSIDTNFISVSTTGTDAVSITGNSEIIGKIEVKSNQDGAISSVVTASFDNVRVSRPTIIDNTLSVEQDTNLNDLTIHGDLNTNGRLSIKGDTILDQNLSVKGDVSISGDVALIDGHFISSPTNPQLSNHLTNKQYVDSEINISGQYLDSRIEYLSSNISRNSDNIDYLSGEVSALYQDDISIYGVKNFAEMPTVGANHDPLITEKTVNEKLTTVYRFKGVKDSYTQLTADILLRTLASEVKNGDVYYVIKDDNPQISEVSELGASSNYVITNVKYNDSLQTIESCNFIHFGGSFNLNEFLQNYYKKTETSSVSELTSKFASLDEMDSQLSTKISTNADNIDFLSANSDSLSDVYVHSYYDSTSGKTYYAIGTQQIKNDLIENTAKYITSSVVELQNFYDKHMTDEQISVAFHNAVCCAYNASREVIAEESFNSFEGTSNRRIEGVWEFAKNMYLDKGLSVGQDISANGNVAINKDLSVNENVYINGNTKIDNNLCVYGPTLIDNTLSVTNNAYVENDITASNNISAANQVLTPAISSGESPNLIINADKQIGISSNNNININASNITIGNTLSGIFIRPYQGVRPPMQGTIDSSDTMIGDASRDINIGGIYVPGEVIIEVKGVRDSRFDIEPFTRIKNNLSVTGNITTDQDISAKGNATINKDLSVDGSAYIDVGLNVNGDTTISNGLNVGYLYVNGNTSLNAQLNVGGPTLINNNLDVAGQTSIDDGLSVLGGSTFIYDLEVETPAQFNTSVNVTENLSAGQIYATEISGNTISAGDCYIGGNLNIAGWKIKDEYLPVTQNIALATTAYDLSHVRVKDGNIYDGHNRSMGTYDSTTGQMLTVDPSLLFNGQVVDNGLLELDTFVKASQEQGDVGGYYIHKHESSTNINLYDRAINIVDSTGVSACVLQFPTSPTAVDFVINYKCGVAPTFPANITFKTDASLEAFSEWQFASGRHYLMTFTQIDALEYFASIKELQ